MFYKLGEASRRELETCEERLKKLVEIAIKITPIDFSITQGYRTQAYQKKMFEAGKSKTLDSKHCHNPSFAFDFVPFINGKQDYQARDDIMFLAGLFYGVAKMLNIDIRSGALWNGNNIKNNNFIDAFHIELKEEK